MPQDPPIVPTDPCLPALEALARLAAQQVGWPMAAVVGLDGDRCDVLATVGIDGAVLAEGHAFTHALVHDGGIELTDARLDARFADDALVVTGPGVRACCALPLRSQGRLLGSLLALHGSPACMTPSQRSRLHDVATAASATLASWQQARDLRGQLTTVLRAMPDLWFMLDRDGRYLECSDEHHRGLSEPFSDSRGRRIDDVLPDTVAAKARQAFDASVATGAAQRFEYGLALPDGVRRVEASFTALGTERILCVVRDLTDTSEALYRSVTAAIADALLVLDARGTIVTANPAACALLGEPLAALVGTPAGQLGFQLERPDGTPLPHDEDPVAELLNGGPDIVGRVLGVRHADGQRRTVSVSAQRLQGLAHADRSACVVTLRDITGQRAAERRLAHAEARWRFALEEAGDGLLDYDDDQQRTFFSPRWKAMLGYAHQDIGHAPQEWSHRIHPADYPQVMRAYRRYRAGDAPEYRSEHRLRHKNGHWVWVLDRAKIIERRPDGSVRRVIGVHTDITRLKAAEHALRDKRAAELASTAKSEFLSRMSHEMRTPLNAVIGFAQLLQMRGEAGRPVPVAQYSEHILQSGRHLLGLVNDVLDLQQVEAGRLSLTLEPVALADALQAARLLVEPAARVQAVTIELGTDGDLQVQADPRRLHQVLLNLMSNAIKYNRPGGVVRCTVGPVDASRAVVTIEDTGDGLTSEQLQRLFQPFERLGRETTLIEGSGLGLVIARALVQEMGGSLTMSSERGTGTRVRMVLPLAAPAGPPVAPPSAAAPAKVGTSPLRMLYVEDNRLNALLFEEAIKLRGGIELRVVEDGPDALELLSDWQPDVFVLDAHLPTMSGYDVLSRVRDMPRFAHTPAFMCSADALPGEITRAHDAGFAGYWSKPIDIAQVMRELDALPAPPAASAAFPR